ncbi:MAG: dihydroorotase [Cyclobacteriaceae bacterium]|nr:dihydroorotase [Cyclobacteriaceae bacterium]MCH8516728.1 dihydroorotase [Cyclobacteriaceae bacterium]
MNILIKDARVFCPESMLHLSFQDLHIKDGKLFAIGDTIHAEGALEVDASECIISAGWADLMVNFQEPGFEFKEDLNSGRAAALAGGFTHVGLAPNLFPVTDNQAQVHFLTAGNDSNITKIHPIGAISRATKGQEMTEMYDLFRSGVKLYSDGFKCLQNTELLLKSMQYLQMFDGKLLARLSDPHLSADSQMHEGIISTQLGLKGEPAIAEEIAVQQAIEILKYVGGQLHISHISSKGTLERIAKAKAEGLKLTCDVALPNLIWTHDELLSIHTNYKLSPPLRTEEDQRALKEGVLDGTIDFITASHQPHDQESKQLEFDLADDGIALIESFLPALRLTFSEKELLEIIPVFSSRVRSFMGIDNPQFKVGEQVDYTLFSLDEISSLSKQTAKSKAVNNPFLGVEMKGKVMGCLRDRMKTVFFEQKG